MRVGATRSLSWRHAAATAALVLCARAAGAQPVSCLGGPGADPCVVTTLQDFANAGVAVFNLGSRALVVQSGGRNRVSPGAMQIIAGSVRVEGGGALLAPGANGTGGNIEVLTSGDVRIDLGGAIETSAAGTAGNIAVQAGGLLQVEGMIAARGSTSGEIRLSASAGVTVSATGLVQAGGGAFGGVVDVAADGPIHVEAGPAGTGIIDVSGRSQAGTLQLEANGPGGIAVTGRCAEALTRPASGGSVRLRADAGVTLSGARPVSVAGGDQFGIGGDVSVDAGGAVLVDGPVLAFGGDGGFIDILAASVTSTALGSIDVGARGLFGDAGILTLIGRQGDVVVQGPIVGHAAGSAFEGGGTAAELDVIGSGDLVLAGPVDLTGPLPDGNGGFLNIVVDGDITQTGAIMAQALGDGCGDDSIMFSAGSIQLGSVDVSGGDCGGGVFSAFAAGVLTANGTVDADSALGPAGVIDLGGMRVDVGGNVHASSSDLGFGGLVRLHACEINVLFSGRVVATGPGGQAILQANGPMTIAGRVETESHLFQYANPAQPPVKLLFAVIIPAVPASFGELVALPPCVCDRDTECDPRGRCAGARCIVHMCTPVVPVNCADQDPATRDVCVLDANEMPECHHVCRIDVDADGSVAVATDVVYIARQFLGLTPVPAAFRTANPTIPPDAEIAAAVAAATAFLDVDGRGGVQVATDVVYLARRLLGVTPVPPQFRVADPTIPSDATIAAAIDALCP